MSILMRRRALMIPDSQKLYLLRGNTYLPTLSGASWEMRAESKSGITTGIYPSESTDYIRLYSTGKTSSNTAINFFSNPAIFKPSTIMALGFSKIVCKFDYTGSAYNVYVNAYVAVSPDTWLSGNATTLYNASNIWGNRSNITDNDRVVSYPLSSLSADTEYRLIVNFIVRTVSINNNLKLKEVYFE